MFKYENEYTAKGCKNIMGIDEAGRGPLAGPVVCAGVIMPLGAMDIIAGVNDSKKLTAKCRDSLYAQIIDRAVAYQISVVDNKIIDEINIYQATKTGMIDCVKNISIKPDVVLIDGNMKFEGIGCYLSIVSGDAKSYTIAAASILAKVTRDRLMCTLGQRYEMYKFEKHKGYPTRLHIRLIEQYGLSDIHRLTFSVKERV
jgi:ribonuclease HII